jgi:ankyrin repeat protein
MAAATVGHFDCMELLLTAGANPHIEDQVSEVTSSLYLIRS